ncbi:MAG: type II toxin-antitoxin system PemK/MazF family toxin [Verrucomicrobiota bacterium]
MKAWDIFSYQPEGFPEPHPCVIVSHPARVANKPEVNILICSSKRATRSAEAHEAILDQSDGLDWPTLCRCDLLLDVPKAELKQRRGRVTPERRRQIIATINRANDWV